MESSRRLVGLKAPLVFSDGFLLRLEVSAPIVCLRGRKAGLDLGGFVDVKDNELRGVAAAFAFGSHAGFPTGTGGTSICSFNGSHMILFLVKKQDSEGRTKFAR